LTAERIILAAVEFVDREGLDKLTTRALAKDLDVEAMALYYYFKSKDALLDAITDWLERQAGARDTSGDWRARLHTMATAQITTALAHPRLAPLMASRRGRTDAVFANNEMALQCLKDAGLESIERVIWLQIYAAQVNGLALYFSAARTPPAEPPEIDSIHFPLVVEAIPVMRRLEPQDVVRTGLETLIDGIEKAAKQASSSAALA